MSMKEGQGVAAHGTYYVVVAAAALFVVGIRDNGWGEEVRGA